MPQPAIEFAFRDQESRMNPNAFKPFPLPVVATLGPGSHVEEEEPTMPRMPQGMSTYVPPPLPEPELLAAHRGAIDALDRTLQALRHPGAADATQVIDLAGLGDADRRLLNQVLGEGEVAAQVLGDDAVQVQESVFAGVWRVVYSQGGRTVRDTIEVGTVPQVLVDAAREDGFLPRRPFDAAPDGVMNAPSLLAEIEDRQRGWHAGQPAHVINLTLLPLSDGDVQHLDAQLGAGRVLILSRGYGNCRITNTRLPRTWRVTYFNSTDIVILDTLEISRIPEVACAAVQDLEDSAERIGEVLDWVRQS
jgi:hydrogenase-1 operon protein HyaF